MICHIVLFRPRAALTVEERAALLEAFETALRDIPFIHRARVGSRVTHGRGYERLMKDDYPFAAILEFADLDALQAYLRHSSHEALGAKLFDSADAVLVYDYRLEEQRVSGGA